MTNYSERLDDVLSAVYLAGTENGLGRSLTDTKEIMHRKEAFIKGNRVSDEAKQAITSLTKELVAEAKPINEQGEIDIDAPAYNDGYYSGAWNTLEKLEHNLLKALEEV